MAILLAFLVTSVPLFLLAVPIGFALGLSCLLIMVVWPGLPFFVVVQKIVTGMDSYTLLAIPFFMLSAEIMNAGDTTRRIVEAFNALFGRFRGSLAMGDVASNIFLSGISGSASADATATGSVLIPAMIRDGYPAPFAAGLTAVASIIGPIIPPSIPLVVYGVITRVPILKLFVAGYVPGLALGGLLFLYVWYVGKRRGFQAKPPQNFREVVSSFRQGIWALMMPVVLVGCIVAGVFTVTELGAVLAVYALFLGIVVHHEFPLRLLGPILRRVALNAANILWIVGTSSVLGYLLVVHGIPDMVPGLIFGVTHNKYWILALINVVFLVAGIFLDSTPATIILVPILLPLIRDLGIDLTHFGLIVVFNLMIGLIHPPVGLTLYICMTISGADLVDILWEILPLFFLVLAVLLLITYVPETVLWLPRKVGL
jgi:tripartite ATP-independent transporter DctM subunit